MRARNGPALSGQRRPDRVRIELLRPEHDAAYEAMLSTCEHSLLFYSLKYRKFLQVVLESSEAVYIGAFESESERLVGVLPVFIKRNATMGPVLNSLPFFGSNGGPLLAPDGADPQRVGAELLEAFNDLAVARKAAASTLISNPLVPYPDLYEAGAATSLSDHRIGQITKLPEVQGSDEAIAEALFRLYHVKTRNCVRKAQKSDLVVSHDHSLEAMRFLAQQHCESISSLGGIAKPWAVFAAIREIFAYDQDYRVYLARRDGKMIAALLVFFHNRSAEYHTPATHPASRIYQPMSLLVFEAMKEAVRRKCLYWNWGGTWKTQDGVYRFKKRWGTLDLPYTYYIRVYNEAILRTSREKILSEYPYFYVVPFGKLRN